MKYLATFRNNLDEEVSQCFKVTSNRLITFLNFIHSCLHKNGALQIIDNLCNRELSSGG